MMPYDQLVAATMRVIKRHLRDGVVIKSDGEHNSGAWGAAMNLYLRTFPERAAPNLDNWPGTRGRVKRGSSHGPSNPLSSEISS